MTPRCPTCGATTTNLDPMPSSRIQCDCGELITGPAPMKTKQPRMLGQYRIAKELGRGSFGSVYLGDDTRLERQVALKVPHPHVLNDQSLRERFLQEARAVARLQHRCVVVIFEVEPEGRYIATEYLPGRTLREEMKDGPLAVERAAWLASELADALAHAHAAGIIHRDIKPSNVILTDRGEVKLIDFGLARIDISSITADQALMGTLIYMSPEQIAGETRKIREPSDQFNLGAVLYEMLCGDPPYGREGRLIALRISQKPPRPSTINPSIPAALDAIIMRTLERIPEDRFPTCRALAEELRRFAGIHLGSEPIGVPPSNQSLPSGPPTADPASSLSNASLAVSLAQPTDESLDPPALARYRPALTDLIAAVTERASSEERVGSQYQRDSASLERKTKSLQTRAITKHETTRAQIVAETTQRAVDSQHQLAAGLEQVAQLHNQAIDRIKIKTRKLIADAEEKLEWSIVQADGILQTRQAEAGLRMKLWREAVATMRRQAEESRTALDALAGRLATQGVVPSVLAPTRLPGRVSARLIRGRINQIAAATTALLNPPRWPGLGAAAPGLASGAAILVLIAIAWAVQGVIAAAIVALVLGGLGLGFWKVRGRRTRTERQIAGYETLCREVAEALATLDARQAEIEDASVRRLARLKAGYDRSIRRDRSRLEEFVTLTTDKQTERLLRTDETLQTARTRLHDEFGTSQDDVERLQTLDRSHSKTLATINDDQLKQNHKIRRRRREDFATLAVRWRTAMESVQADLAAIEGIIEPLNPAWESPAWDDWYPPIEYHPLIRFGEVRVGLDRLPHGLPEDPRLIEGLPTELAWPILLRLHGRSNLLVEVPEEAAPAASAVLQAVTMRLIAALPSGQVRLTIVDPLGLGGDFGPFLQLADFDESLATLQTDPDGIEQSLGDLVGHIRKMFRSYFRADIRSIYEFNQNAQEVAEPIRILVVAGFPNGFSLAACEYLARIVDRGAQCGVLAIVAADRKKPIPGDLTLASLSKNAVHLVWKNGRFAWEDNDFGSFNLMLEPPPPATLVADVMSKVGASAIDARRVQIPFDLVAPPRDLWWLADSRAGIDVPLGRSGISKFQSMTLGRGTSQHVLVAGRTGSGKSTLLHALITNLALNYHPDALELYLIDFKKGVEFNIYAVNELPHARVIAIESEREFGVSVLQRLDEELKERGERFRQAGAQDLKSYRAIPGLPPLPRVLLIVDEFQEFFVEDDPLAAKATLLLDRLVRQGRAFGVHILLGSQSLGGAYGLARATFGQMSVRIALQCSETDSRIILSEDNGAARLLSRSGEAIYNDANGMNEGNHFFQVVWQPENVREDYLKRIRDFARDRQWTPRHPPVIFEGNAASDLAKNLEIKALLAAETPTPPAANRPILAYLGEAIEIKPPTSARFRRISGDNLLIIGQDAEVAHGMMAAALLSLAAQYPASGPGAAEFWVLSEPEDDADEAADLSRIWDVPSQPLRRGGRAETAALLADLAQIVAERTESNSTDSAEHFLFIANLAAFRLLQRPEDDFSLEARDPALPSNALAAILKDGAAVGVHLIIWCDSMNNLNRTIDRAGRREFGSKVALQMSAADSANYLDSAAASRLGFHRAILSNEVQGRIEKFRPYALPPAAWTTWARERLHRDPLPRP